VHVVKPKEHSSFVAWTDGAEAEWKAQLTPRNVIYGGVNLQEADGGGGTDGCWFPNSTVPKLDKITGGSWTVSAGNWYDPDYVGWTMASVNYYRSQHQNRLPCSFSFPQLMQIVITPQNAITYQTNTLGCTIGVGTVSSTRDGNTVTRQQ
jgi:hypothetical protein